MTNQSGRRTRMKNLDVREARQRVRESGRLGQARPQCARYLRIPLAAQGWQDLLLGESSLLIGQSRLNRFKEGSLFDVPAEAFGRSANRRFARLVHPRRIRKE